jgi:hypothetical protein
MIMGKYDPEKKTMITYLKDTIECGRDVFLDFSVNEILDEGDYLIYCEVDFA